MMPVSDEFTPLPSMLFFGVATIILLNLLRSLSESKQHYVSWKEFVEEMLAKGEVSKQLIYNGIFQKLCSRCKTVNFSICTPYTTEQERTILN